MWRGTTFPAKVVEQHTNRERLHHEAFPSCFWHTSGIFLKREKLLKMQWYLLVFYKQSKEHNSFMQEAWG